MTNPTAIIVDDDHDLAHLFSDFLELHQVKIIGIGYDGRDAIRLVKEKNPEIVFLDMDMPELSGEEALKGIKKIYPKTHVIMITGNHFADKKKFLEYDAAEIVYKPFDFPKIMQTIENMDN
jgi:DNA-binding NtrC family response regulator